MDHPGRLSWFGERGAKGSISGCLARQRGAGNEGRATKASPSWHMLNHGVYSIGVRPCRAQQPSARSQPFDQQSLTLTSSKKFRLTLSHEGTTHCDLSKLRARHMKRHMNEGTAKKGPDLIKESDCRKAIRSLRMPESSIVHRQNDFHPRKSLSA